MNCPKCNSKAENKASFFWLGFLGRAAFPKYVCPTCGKLEIKDFSEDIRKKITLQRVICGILFFAVLILIIVFSFSQ